VNAPEQLEHLTGLIERVTFHSADTGFCVLQIKVRGQRDLVSVVGALASATAGEWLDARGDWAMDKTYGRQFKARFLRTTHPSTPEGIEKYLGSGLIRGIGPGFAGKLVRSFGAEVFEVIEKAPERLLDVEGIGPVRQGRLVSSWQEQKLVREIMVFLHSHGVGTSRAFRIYKTYGEEAIEKVQENPYRLAQDIWGIGFKSADKIAESLGISRHSDIRARAGVEYVLGQLTEDGHCAFAREGLVERAVKMLEIPPPIIEEAVDAAAREDRLVIRERPDGSALVYLASLEAAERALARNLVALLKGQHPCPAVHLPKDASANRS